MTIQDTRVLLERLWKADLINLSIKLKGDTLIGNWKSPSVLSLFFKSNNVKSIENIKDIN
jgi:hypothetical protein